MRFYIVAGEASGDMHAADLIREMKSLNPNAQFRAWGGDLMKEQGAEIVKHYRDLAFMGFTEVVMNLKTILNNISLCKEDILRYKPDAVILVDYPGFNLRIAGFAKENDIRVYYYISPQVWAWKSSRVKKIKEVVNKMFVILPFEKAFYKKFNYDVEYVGHPLPEIIKRKKSFFSPKNVFLQKYDLTEKPIISLLPGSRRQEIVTMLPIMLSIRKDFPDFQFVVAAAPSQPYSLYADIINDKLISVISDATYELLHHSQAALVTSGTATLETALLNVPEVVCYKGGRLSYYIARSLIKIRFISLVNLIMDREVVKELIQDDLNSRNLSLELKNILDLQIRERVLNDYKELNNILSSGGAADKTARMIMNDMK
jgi:lipid-A-disaccharide synthase